MVWSVLMDSARYREWNPRLLAITGTLAAGQVVTLDYKKDRAWLPARFVVDVDVCAPERELRWSGPRNPARALFRASHSFTLSPDGAGTALVHAEAFAGTLAPLLWPLLARAVADNHADVNTALRARAEACYAS
jgi:hypothetical protein